MRTRGFEDCTPGDRDERAREDEEKVEALARACDRFMADLGLHEALWNRTEQVPLSSVERVTALCLFDRAVDLQLAAESISSFHMHFWRIDPSREPVRHARHFALAHRAYFRRLTVAMDLCRRTRSLPQFETLLDEGASEYGIAPGLWARFKWNALHIEHIGRALAAHAHARVLLATLDEPRRGADDLASLLGTLDLDWQGLKPLLQTDSPSLLVENAIDILRDLGRSLLLPVQAGVATWLGDTRVGHDGRALISAKQIAQAVEKTRPGDVVFERRNWYLSNLGLPGFWPHTAIWTGTPDELARALDDDPEVRASYRGSFRAWIERTYPERYAEWCLPDEGGHPRRIIEAVSEGVVIASAEHSLRADYAAALRPRRPPIEVARSIETAFGYLGRPYDFDFDFYSDQSLVCSELVYKSWEPGVGREGVSFALVEVLGRMTLPPNDMIGWWARGADEPESALEFVWFLDGREHEGDAVWRDEPSLRASYLRAKWDISQD